MVYIQEYNHVMHAPTFLPQHCLNKLININMESKQQIILVI